MAVFVETYLFGRKSKFWVRFEVAHLMCSFRAADDPTRVRFEVVHLVYMFGDANGPNRDRFEVAHLVCMFGAANDPIRVRMEVAHQVPPHLGVSVLAIPECRSAVFAARDLIFWV